MKKLVTLAVAVIFVCACAPAFAGGSKCQASGTQEKSLFQLMGDSITDTGKTCPKPKASNKMAPAGPSCFQRMSDGIAEGSAKAKTESLRNSGSK